MREDPEPASRCAISTTSVVSQMIESDSPGHPVLSASASSFLRSPSRRAALLVAGLTALTAAGILLTDRADSRRAVRLALADGARFDDSLTLAARAGTTAPMPFQSAVALSYLARLEAGLGSPFRLVDLARSEPRLPAVWRPRVAHAMLSRIARGVRVMRPAPDALDIAVAVNGGPGAALLQLIDSVMVADGDSPMTLEVLRIAAAQTSARGLLRPSAVALIDAAAVMAFDRQRARRDVDRVVAAASRSDGDLTQVVALWRVERRFLVERPLLAEEATSPRRVAARIPAMIAAFEGTLRTPAPSAASVTAAPLPEAASRALAMLMSVRTRPVQPQVSLSVLEARTLAARDARSSRAYRLLLGATNEETLVMTQANAFGDPALRPIASAAVLLASQGLRTLAQEAPFHPGTLTLRPEQVVSRLRLASLRFGRDVPVAWQPFYAREFAAAVDALTAVFPRASFAGLNVRIGGTVTPGALAVHDPRSRTLMLPLATGFGAVGHELMHDLDWQSARDYSGREGTYATDNAARATRRQPIAAPLARLAEFVSVKGTPNSFVKEARRPAELLARGADWFLASALAREGRSNGTLSAVQDSWVRGYASAAGPAAFGDHAAALAALFDEMPVLSSRASLAPRSDNERGPDLATIARAAWYSPLPAQESRRQSGALTLIPLEAGDRCSPVTRLQLAPIRQTAREVALGFLEPRITRSMLRWARATNPDSLPGDVAMLRLALLGSPVKPGVMDSARKVWLRSAMRTLPCLGE